MGMQTNPSSPVSWKLAGTYFEACNCESACPCVWFNAPSEGNCKLFVAWHIDQGHYGDRSLDDVSVALACYAPGHMKDGAWDAALYLDERATAEQQDALTRIFGGQAGGHPALLMSFVGKVLGVKATAIEYQADGNRRTLRMPGTVDLDIEAITGIAGGTATITNPPLCVVPSHPAVVARSKTYRYTDYGFDWTISERNGYYSPLVYEP